MKCPHCSKKLVIVHTIPVGSSRAQSAECSHCSKRFTFVTLFLCVATKKHGTGVRSLARRLTKRLDAGLGPPKVSF